MLKKLFLFPIWIYSVLFCSTLFAQNYPIQSSLMLKGAASPFVSDYVRAEENPLQLTLVNSDASFSGHVVFKFSIKGVGMTIESNQAGTTVFSVSSGTPLILSGSDLSEYFLSSNLTFSGYSKAQYESKGVLPEGLYEFSFQAFNAERREVAVSNKAMALVWIQLHDPPQLVFPQNESIVEAKTPQQISFSWQATTLTNTNYILELYELKGVENRNAAEVIRGASPVFTTTTTSTTYNYTIKDPLLLEGMKYAWRIKAEAITNSNSSSTAHSNQLIKNEGYSSLFAFTYLPKCTSPQIINRIPNKNGTAKINWMGDAKVYLIQYREKGQTDWYEELSSTETITITQLRPEHTYEYRIESRCEYNKSNFTAIDTFSIPVSKNGINLTPPTGGYPDIQLDKSTYLPQEEAAPGTTIYVNHFEMKLGMAIQDERTKLYTGTGSIYVPMLKANVSVEFRNVQFNKARRLVEGKIYARQKEAPKTKIPPLKKVPQICITYGPDGYDQEGRDKEGYDRAGYNKDNRDKEGYDKSGYDKNNLDRNGNPKQNPKDPLQVGQQATDPTKPKDATGNNTTQNGTNGNSGNTNGTTTTLGNIFKTEELKKIVEKAFKEYKEELSDSIKMQRKQVESWSDKLEKAIKDAYPLVNRTSVVGKDNRQIGEGMSKKTKIGTIRGTDPNHPVDRMRNIHIELYYADLKLEKYKDKQSNLKRYDSAQGLNDLLSELQKESISQDKIKTLSENSEELKKYIKQWLYEKNN